MSGDLFTVRLGDGAACAASIDMFPQATADILQWRVKGASMLRGTRAQILGVLWSLEASPAYFAGGGANGADCEPWATSAITRTIKTWRIALGMSPSEKVPTPEWARRAP